MTRTFTLAFVLAASGCAQEPRPGAGSPVRASDVRRETGEALRTTGRYIKQELEEFRRASEQGLARLDERAHELGDWVRTSRRWREVEEKRAIAAARLEELKTASGERAVELRRGVDDALADLRATINRAGVEVELGPSPAPASPAPEALSSPIPLPTGSPAGAAERGDR